jgi:hypothetical protein
MNGIVGIERDLQAKKEREKEIILIVLMKWRWFMVGK